ncbi:HK97 gp10 family phage protein [uncultured Phascolarctobacterium sp.]|uniref:HK97 gp10 family phage protein n=1 Tax=uncultured Phascolarctobacterium sp. TaxID=512296 RepID=UPI0027D98428|nr:HK97 gp10 family phage protein [uncultured Phascolarctobacterium sp.]
MGANYSQLVEFSNKLKRLNDVQREQYIEGAIKEIAARLLAKVIKRTPVGIYNDGRVGGTLRRGWTGEKRQSANQYIKSLNVRKQGNTYIIDIINNVEYASYVEYGHRTSNHKGWVKGKFMLTISAQEIEQITPQILEKRLEKLLREVVD